MGYIIFSSYEYCEHLRIHIFFIHQSNFIYSYPRAIVSKADPEYIVSQIPSLSKFIKRSYAILIATVSGN